jgi:ABC-type iron transport system FetAB ATPase subunit
MATIATIKEAVTLCAKANITAFIWGDRGLGKSSLVKQMCESDNMGFIDFRASQIEASDLRGLPDKEDGRTVYRPPADLPTGDLDEEQFEALVVQTSHDIVAKRIAAFPASTKISDEQLANMQAFERQAATDRLAYRRNRGILFLDEVNRAQDDVTQAIFQLVLDRRIGQYILPEGWSIVCAGNFMEGYQVSGFSDPAFVNRFCHLILSGGQSTFDEWIEFMMSKYGSSCQSIIDFTANDVKYLDGDLGAKDLGFSIQPSRRTWEMVQKVELVCSKEPYSDITKLEVISGLIGRELAISYTRYNCPLKPTQLLKDGIKHHAKTLSALTRNQSVGLMWGLSNAAKDDIDKKATATVCLDYAEHLLKNAKDQDLVVAFLRSCVRSSQSNGDGKNNLATAALTNIKLAKMFAEATKAKPTFLNHLHDRPELQKMVSEAAWGTAK